MNTIINHIILECHIAGNGRKYVITQVTEASPYQYTFRRYGAIIAKNMREMSKNLEDLLPPWPHMRGWNYILYANIVVNNGQCIMAYLIIWPKMQYIFVSLPTTLIPSYPNMNLHRRYELLSLFRMCWLQWVSKTTQLCVILWLSKQRLQTITFYTICHV